MPTKITEITPRKKKPSTTTNVVNSTDRMRLVSKTEQQRKNKNFFQARIQCTL